MCVLCAFYKAKLPLLLSCSCLWSFVYFTFGTMFQVYHLDLSWPHGFAASWLLSFSFLAHDSMLSTLCAIANPSVCPSVRHVGGSVENRLRSCNFHHTVAPSLSYLWYKCHPEIPTGFPRAGASNKGGLGKRANIVGVLTLSPGGSTRLTVRITVEESKCTVNRQVAALLHANPGVGVVSSAFLLLVGISAFLYQAVLALFVRWRKVTR